MYKPLGSIGNPAVQELPRRRDVPRQRRGRSELRRQPARDAQDVWNAFDRFIVGEYRDRFAGGKAGITLRGYAQEFMRGLFPLAVLAPSTLIQGGLTFEANWSTTAVGGAFDADIELGKKLRVLYGAEAFNEWLPDHAGSTPRAAAPATFESPYDLTRLPLPCPRMYDPNTMSLVPVAVVR
jgi:hypothetical protein